MICQLYTSLLYWLTTTPAMVGRHARAYPAGKGWDITTVSVESGENVERNSSSG